MDLATYPMRPWFS